MAGISFGGMASGLPPNIVDQLMQAERIPLRNMENKKADSEAKLKLVSELETKLKAITGTIGELASSKGFSDIKVTSGDPNIVTGVADPNKYIAGNWNVEVMELPQKAAALTNGFPDRDKSQLGTGYFKFETADGQKEVYIKGENSTLDEVANTINSAGVGVKATVINDRKNPDEPYRLMISGQGVGDESSIKYPTLYFLDGDQDVYFHEQKQAKNGTVKIDGFEFQVADTVIEDLIPGVSLDLKQASPGKTVNITVKEDQEVVAGKVKGFVDAINEVFSFIQSQNRMNENTDTSRTLGGDSLLRSVENRLRRLIQNPVYGVDSNLNRLNQLGIQFSRNGTLEYKEDSFNTALKSNPDGVQKFFAGDGFTTGFIPQLKNTLKVMTDLNFGPVTNRKKGLQNKIDQIDRRIESTERRLDKKEQSLKRKFANLETTMSKLKQQQGQLAAIGGGGGGGGGIASLI
ncbi:MAG: flagellar filament capping protein FliD [Bdellovibrionales bacterium]|nr:flagellar filament capping protein FliD [Bdellovibrionales bacterium]